VALFVRMWAIAHVIHLSAATDGRLDTPWNVATVVAALVLVLRPHSGGWLVVLALAQLADLVAEMPTSPDHWMLLAVVNLAILVTFAWRRSTSPAALAAAFPAARVVMLVAYTAAALAKYNTTFLEPVTSCATAIAGAASYGLTDGLGLDPLFVAAVLLCESAIPVLLLIPRTRRYGVRLGLGFHFLLSASPAFAVVDFTAALFALFLLFLPTDEVLAVLDRLSGWASRSAIVRDARRVPAATATLAFVVFGVLGYLTERGAAAFLLVGSELYLFIVLLAVVVTWRPRPAARQFGRVRWVQVPVLVLVVLWAASPHLGFRTTGVFTMFSNLRTEGTLANHLFLPSAHLTPWQTDVVVIEASNDSDLSDAGSGHLAIPLLELRRMAEADPDLVVEGTLDGESVTFGAGPEQTAWEPIEGWGYRFLHFRPVPADGAAFCGVS